MCGRGGEGGGALICLSIISVRVSFENACSKALLFLKQSLSRCGDRMAGLGDDGVRRWE